MPGPQSEPKARDPKTGRIIAGKSALRHANLRSGEGMSKVDYTGKSEKKQVVEND